MADGAVYINIEEGLKRVVNNAGLYVRLLVKFKDDKNLNELETALAAGDLEKAQTYAHTLKGLSANLSLIELQKQSLEVESQIKLGSVKPDQVTIIKNVYTQTLVEIEKVIAKYG